MIAAVYARKSTQQDEAGATSESVARQLEHGAAFAKLRGFSLGPSYHDDAVSGAEYAKLTDRARMVADAEAGRFTILIVAEQSRLGRDLIDSVSTIRRIAEAGGRIFTYTTGEEIAVEDEVQQIMTMLRGFGDASERRKASQRTRDGLRRRAARGAVAGNRLFGYSQSRATDGFVYRSINPTEAKVIRRIFTEYADGHGVPSIAQRLNRDHVPAPRAGGWSRGAVRAMLRNEHFVGVLVWGKRRSTVKKGKLALVRNDESGWLRTSRPDLRIVPESLWRAVHEKLEARRASYPRDSTGRLLGRPHHTDESRYLLTGFAECAECHGSIRITNRGTGHKGERRHLYSCATFEARGKAKCTNRIVVRHNLLERAIIADIGKALRPQVLDVAVERALRKIHERDGGTVARRVALQKELQEITVKERRLIDAIATGERPQPIVNALKELGDRRVTLEHAIAKEEHVVPLDAGKLKRELRDQVRDILGLLETNAVRGRQMLRRILSERISCTPFHEGTRRGFRYSGKLAIGRLISGEVATRLSVESGTGSCTASRRAGSGCAGAAPPGRSRGGGRPGRSAAPSRT